MLNQFLSLIFAELETALPEFLYEEYWTLKRKLLGASSMILGNLTGYFLCRKNLNPFSFIYRRLDKRREMKEREEEEKNAFWKRWN